MTHETINLLLATAGPVVVVGGVALTQLIFVALQTPRINAEIVATEPEGRQQRPAPTPARRTADRVPA